MPIQTPIPLRQREPSRRRNEAQPLRRRRPVPAAPSRRWRKALNSLLLFVTVVLIMDALIGDKGFMETMRARHQSRALADSLQRLATENAKLREMARRLREDPATIEAIARKELGLVRPGEVLVILK